MGKYITVHCNAEIKEFVFYLFTFNKLRKFPINTLKGKRNKVKMIEFKNV